jgi:hypothetical protein
METIARVAARFFSKERDESYIIECETSSGCPLMNELDKASLLDARIIRGACPTCGGIGQVPATHMPAGATERCPDCANTPVWVIEPAAWGAFVCAVQGALSKDAILSEPDGETVWRIYEQRGVIALQALLPGARVAKEIMTVDALGETRAAIGYLDRDVLFLSMRDGDQIAILATPARKEVEDE